MGIIAEFLVQNTLKFLLEFGKVSPYLGYSAITDFFPSMEMKPNPSCTNSMCRKRQSSYQALITSKAYIEKTKREEEARLAAEAAEAAKPLHEDNEWSIEVIEDDGGASNEAEKSLPSGLKYEMPEADAAAGGDDAEDEGETMAESSDANVEDLMSQLNSIQGVGAAE